MTIVSHQNVCYTKHVTNMRDLVIIEINLEELNGLELQEYTKRIQSMMTKKYWLATVEEVGELERMLNQITYDMRIFLNCYEARLTPKFDVGDLNNGSLATVRDDLEFEDFSMDSDVTLRIPNNQLEYIYNKISFG